MVATARIPIRVLTTFSDFQYNRTQRNRRAKGCEIKTRTVARTFSIAAGFTFAQGLDIPKIC